jgi:DNA-binding winged helix-turn-helix (wHTH) protein/TolB-like protein
MSDEPIIYEFGDFHLDLAEKQLRRSGGPSLTLPPKAFELLAYLASNPGRLLEKNELMDSVWADSFVEEGNLKLHIHTLRKILDQSGDAFIETIPRRGYRFNADVRTRGKGELVIEKVTQSKLVVQETEVLNAAPRGVRRWRYGITLTAVVVVAAAAYFGVIRPRALFGSAKPEKLAVLPFEYIGDKTTESEYLQLGLSDALITRLGNLHSVKVRPTSSVRRYSDQQVDLDILGRELDVDSILEGTIRREADHVRVSTQLVRLSDRTILWTETFSESNSSLFMLEDDIALRLAHSLTDKLSPEEA